MMEASLKKKRCIIPVDGFYEWKATPGEKRKQPYFIHRLDGEPLAFAGLWETWRGADRQAEQTLYSSTIITTSANETMQPIHDRMPVILPASKWDEWLDPKNDDIASLQGLLIPAPAHLLTMHPVSTDVNKVSNKGPHLIDPAAPE
jgi:putative SOS response-associated peptidase YedK